jgi:hypothetical protein
VRRPPHASAPTTCNPTRMHDIFLMP